MDRRVDLVLLLLYARGPAGTVAEPITGITRLTKLLFLLEKETNASNAFKFVPYKMGPYSSEINPVIEFLTSFPTPDNPLVFTGDGDAQSGASPEQSRYIEEVASMDDSAQQLSVQNNKQFKLTERGEKVAKYVWDKQEDEVTYSFELIKKRYGGMSLRQLLKYVYSKYPDMTQNSEIKDYVNGNN